MSLMLPREKIRELGPAALEDHELLALILGRGTRKENVFALSQRLLKNFDREELIHQNNLDKLCKSLMTGKVQTAQLMASFELGRRIFASKINSKQLQSTDDVYEVVRNMQYLKKEYLRGLYLNSRYRIIHDEIISIGSLDSNILHPRDIFRPAIEYNAYAIILAHNHPSGESDPSGADIETTRKLLEIGVLLQIPVLDHIVVGTASYSSLHRLGHI